MRVNWLNVLLQGVNFLVLVWILKRVLYARILAVIARRKAEVERQLGDAAAEKARLHAERAKAEVMTAIAAKEGDKALEVAHAQATAEATRLQEAARREAEAIVESGRQRLAEERDEAARKLEAAAARLSVSMAERLLAELEPGTVTALLLRRAIAHLDGITPARLAALRAELAHGDPAVATAVPLEPAERADAARRLAERLGVTTDHVTFVVDPALVAGAELRLPASAVAFTWRGALDQLALEVVHDHPR
jgi:F-type H+-transporting ATPase subunit b